MGNAFSISCSLDGLLRSCWDWSFRHLNYLCDFQEDVEALESACEKLTALRKDVEEQVEMAERDHNRRPLEQVRGWLSRVRTLETQVAQLIADGRKELEQKCLGGCCPRHCCTQYKFGKKVAKMLEDVEELIRENPQGLLPERIPPPGIIERPSEALTVGVDSRLAQAWRSIHEEQVGIVGLYGLGGVGKTTLLTEINNAFIKRAHDFDFVIWATVSRHIKLDSIQDDIWRKIGFCDDRWKSQGREVKATSIWNVLNKKRFVLLLDDVWERLDLKEVGVPLQSKKNKLVFTTRLAELCDEMEADKKIRVECLTWTESWELFQKKVGEDTLNSQPDVPELAQVVARECCGLPLVLTTIGRAMACKKTPEEWKYAIKVLQSSASKFPGMGDEVLPLLKYTYDCLPSDVAKSCFLYFSLFPEDFGIFRAELLGLWICEGFLDEFDDREGAVFQGSSIIGTLINGCLLEESNYDNYMVKLHDVIRDMALWIACESGSEEDKFLVHAGYGLTEAPEVGRWMGPKRISLMYNQIEQLIGSPNCPNLVTLFLNNNHLKVISDSFFELMPKLRVLNLKNNGITELPRGISKLVSLQHLDLSHTQIKELPIELKNLGELKYLMLQGMPRSFSIPKMLISSLSNLQVMYMSINDKTTLADRLPFDDYEALVEEVESLKNLNDFGIPITTASAFNRLLRSDKLRRRISSVQLLDFEASRSLNIITSLNKLDILYALNITDCSVLEDLEIDRKGKERMESNYFNSKVSFQRVEFVRIDKCRRLKDLTWLVFAPNLKYLMVESCNQMQEVVGRRKYDESGDENGESPSPFAKLQQLSLRDLPQLRSIFWKVLPFILLKGFHVYKCPLLKKLPLDANNAKPRRTVISGETEWWNEVDWGDDEATRDALVACFIPAQE